MANTAMNLSDLIDPNASVPGPVAGYWRAVTEFSLGGNDTVGDCVFCTAANYIDLIEAVRGDPQLVPEAEVERWYAWETGWTRANPSSDKGEVLENMLRVWRDDGNPSDPMDKLTDYCAIKPFEIPQAIHSLGAVPAWCVLPMVDGDWDFTDGGLAVNGTGAHAVLIVESNPTGLKIVSWADVKTVSHAWWSVFGAGQYAVKHPDWRVPLA